MARSTNSLLSAMSSADFALLEPHGELVELEMRFQLQYPDKPIAYAYFIEAGLGSLLP